MISATRRGWYFSDNRDSTFNRDVGRMAMKMSRRGGWSHPRRRLFILT